jgi:hypothetical protein
MVETSLFIWRLVWQCANLEMTSLLGTLLERFDRETSQLR